jgi:bifunctional DNA-binding transcriptional regulator/antitoxin component of YhaV-PrlF toxin-antitoxin module
MQENIREPITITDRGALVLPARMRKAMGIKGKQQLLAELEADGSVRLQAAELFPIEIYTDERIAEFEEENKLVGEIIRKYRKN